MGKACLLLVPQRRCVHLGNSHSSRQNRKQQVCGHSVLQQQIRTCEETTQKQELKTRYYSVTAKLHTSHLFGTVQWIIASILYNSEYTPEMVLKLKLL